MNYKLLIEIYLIIMESLEMKKIILPILFILLSTGLFAENQLMIQGLFGSTGRTYTDGSNKLTDRFPVLGLNIIGFSAKSGDVGFYSSVSIAAPREIKEENNGNDTGASLDSFNSLKYDIDGLFGFGYALGQEEVRGLLAIGPHMNALFLGSTSYYIDTFSSLSLGLGGAATIQYYFFENINVNLTAMAAYDFFDMTSRTVSSEASFSGFTYGISAGLGMSY